MGAFFGSGFFRSPPVVVGLVFAGVIACAKSGGSRDLGFGDTEVLPSEPEAPANPLPPSSSSGSSGGDDSGASSSGSSGSSSGGTDSGADGSAADAAADAKIDATVDAGADAGGTCVTVAPTNACGLAPQCGCGANQTCDVTNTANGGVSCVLAGGGTLGSFCTSTTQCAKGTTCGYNACRPYCPTIGAACVGAGLGPCAQYYDPVAGTPIPNSKVCAVTCDLRNPAAACGSNNCIFDTTVNATDCDKVGTKALYDTCTRYNDCQSGLACADHPVFGFECERWCRIGQNDCGLLESCTDVYGAVAPMSGGVKLGHCQ
jgi:hypothetical protein